MRKFFSIDLENEKEGIGIYAESEEEARRTAENPMNWKDKQPRKVSHICMYEE